MKLPVQIPFPDPCSSIDQNVKQVYLDAWAKDEPIHRVALSMSDDWFLWYRATETPALCIRTIAAGDHGRYSGEVLMVAEWPFGEIGISCDKDLADGEIRLGWKR